MKNIKGRCESIEDRDRQTGIVTITFKIFESEDVITAAGPMARAEKDALYVLEGEYADGVFMFMKSRKTVTSREESIDIMTSFISGLSRDLAKRIASSLGEDLYSYCELPDFDERLNAISGIGEKRITALKKLINEGTDENDVYARLCEAGVPLTVVLSFIKDNRKNPKERLKEKPYVLMRYGADFAVCDRLALEGGMDIWDMERVRAVIRQAVKDVTDRGHTRVEMGHLLKSCRAVSSRNGKEKRIPQAIIEWTVLTDKDLICRKEDEKTYVSPAWLCAEENSIAEGLKRISLSARTNDIDLQKAIGAAEEATGISYTEEQKEAFSVLRDGGIAILTGGPGTGKTTTISGIVRGHKALFPEKKVLLCAPTGRAASRMAELGDVPAMTMHKALGLTWYGKGNPKGTSLDYGLIIADEMSMCDTELLSVFVKNVKDGTTVIFSGDDNQLPSVGPGQVFKDMLDSGKFPVYRFTKTIRQGSGSLICANADALLNGREMTKGKGFHVINVSSNDEALSLIKRIDTKRLPQILIPIKKHEAGTFAVNLLIQDMLNLKGVGKTIDGVTYRVGDRVIMGSNRYDIGYMNGDVGTVEEVLEEGLKIRFPDKTLSVSLSDADGINLAYALTVHKSQGTECEDVLIVLPEGSERMASRKLLYTAITRAKRNVTIITVNDNIKSFMTDNRREDRHTGLSGMLLDL